MSHLKPPGAERAGFVCARRILTLEPRVSGDAIWWREGRVQAVGRASDLARQVPPGIPTFELRDTVVTPGFVDGHTHFAMWAMNRRRVQLTGAGSREEVLRRVASAPPVQGWVVGQGWDANAWDRAPDRGALDAVQPGPVYLDSLDVHAAWVNSAALASAGITRVTADPYGGRIVRDAAGEPTGLATPSRTPRAGNSLICHRFWSQPRPRSHSPAGRCAAAAATAAATASGDVSPFKDRVSSATPRPYR